MKSLRVLALAGCMAAALSAQQFKFDLDAVAAKASDTVDLALNGATLQFAAKFLDSSKDPDEAKVKKLIAGLDGIYLKTFEFKKAGEYSPADLEAICNSAKRMAMRRMAEDAEELPPLVWNDFTEAMKRVQVQF